MKQFVVKLLAFAAPLLCLFMGLEILVRQIPNNYSYKRHFLDHHCRSVRILVLGSSHSLYGVDPEQFSRPAFNAAHVSQTLKFDLFILDKYVGNMPDLDCVCLPVSYFSITSELEHVNEGRRTKNYVIYYGYREFGLQLKDHLETANSPVRRLVRSVGNYYSSGMDHVTCSPEGFGLSYTNAPQLDLEKTGIAAADRHTNDDRSASVANEYYLSRIVEICRHHGVRLLLFTPPACRSYHERLCNSQLKRVVRTCEGLAKENEHIDYVNLLHSPVFAEDDFRDADHLNGEGAVKLTKILDQLLKR